MNTKINKKKIRNIAIILVGGLILFGCLKGFLPNNKSGTNEIYTIESVETRDIVKSLDGSGTLKPANSYTVMTLVEGDILSSNFEEGDKVEKDTVLYKIDSSDTAKNIEKVQISLNQAKRNYDNVLKMQYVESPINGRIHHLNVNLNDDISQGEVIAVIRDSDTMTLEIPFLSDDAKTFSLGQEAIVTLDNTFETVLGTITKISGTDTVGLGNMITRNVTIDVKNAGGISNSQAATASVGNIYCAGSGTFKYKSEENVISTIAGTVIELNFKEGDKISKNDRILKLGGDSLENQIQNSKDSLRNAELSMEMTEDQLDNYTITSPINGTIVDKKYKIGDTVEAGKQLCTIYDLDYLEMVLNVDELDISDISVGQPVKITADAIQDVEYEGIVTKVSVAGITTGGTTSYPVTIRIDKTDKLLPGMNANSEIIIDEVKEVLSIPNEAIERDDMVLITADSPSASNALKDKEAPDGYVYVTVETGLSGEDYVEIRSGLNVGDKIAYIPADGASNILSTIMSNASMGR